MMPGEGDVTRLETEASMRTRDDCPATTDYRAGERLAEGYRILRPHASGGLGEVLVALDEPLNREVALKQIRRELADDPQSRARFLVEAEVTGGLEHPGIVPVYALGFDGAGRPYYAMRFVRGETLKDAIRRFSKGRTPDFGSMEFRGLLERFLDVCNVMAYAHDRGVLHRDLKPSNVMLGKYGETLVLDWGLAKSLGHAEPSSGRTPDEPAIQPISGSGMNPTVFGMTVGTPHFMSPEQALGRLDQLGPASDVYSLGATLYNLLTGKPPLAETDDQGEVIRRVAAGDIRGARDVLRAVPQPLDGICRKAMAVRSEDRYASPLDLAGDLQRWLADEPISGIRETLGRRLSRWERRNRLLVRASGAALLAITLISLGAAFAIEGARGRERDALRAEQSQRQLADRQRERAEELQRASQERSCSLLFERGLELADRLEYGKALLWLAQALADVPEHRPDLEHAIRAATDVCQRFVTAPVAMIEHHGSPIVAMAYASNGRLLATGAADGTVRLWDAASGEPRGEALSHDGEVVALMFAARAPVLLVATDRGEVVARDAETGRPLRPAMREDGPIVAAAISGDGRRLAIGRQDGAVRLVETSSGDILGGGIVYPGPVVSVSFSTDDRLVLSGSEDGTVRLSDATSGAARAPAIQHGGRLTTALSRPDGGAVLTAGADGFARLWDAATGAPVVPPMDHHGPITEAVFHPGGTHILTMGDVTIARLWNATTGMEEVSREGARGHQNYVQSAAISPDGRRVVTASLDRTAGLWELPGDRRAGNPLPHDRGVVSVVFAPAGRTVVTRDDRGRVRLWRLGLDGPPTAPLELPRPVLSIALTLDDRRIVTGGEPGGARFRDLASGEVVGPSLEQRALVWAVALSRDERRVAIAGFSKAAQVWEVESGEPIGKPMPSDREIVSVAFSPNGALLATGSRDETARLFDAATGEPRGEPMRHPGRLMVVRFTPDGTALVTGCEDGVVRFWDVATGRLLDRTFRHEDGVRALDFHPGGRLIATGSLDGTARLWDLESGRPVGPPLAHDGWVTSLAFSPDGRTLATGSLSRTLRFWDVETGLALGPALWHGRAVWTLTYRHDGQAVLTGSDDRRVRVWPVPRAAMGNVADLAREARILSALRLDDDGTYHAMTAEEWESERRESGKAAP
jgi:WD40 repeat protein/tRNA A-37 threonylcarbamoyl transferase component Bud32